MSRALPAPAPAASDSSVGYGALLRLAGPVMLGSLTQSIIYLTDSLFVGPLGEAALAAVGLGGLLFYLLTTVGAGLGTALQILMARRLAQQRPGAAQRLFVAAVYLALGLGVAMAAGLYALAASLSTWLLPSAAVAAELTRYLHVAALALPPALGWLVLVGRYMGLGTTRLIPLSTVAIALANVLGNYAWVTGRWGAPALGIGGAAWAAVLSESVGMLVLLGGLWWERQHPWSMRPRSWRWPRRAGRRLARFAGPLVLRQMVEVSGWLLFFVLVAQLGSRALAASNIARSLYTVASLPALALATALQTLASRQVAGQQSATILPMVRRATLLALGLSLGPAAALALAPAWLASWFTTEAGLLAACIPLLRLLAGLLLTFSASTMLFHAVVGVGGADRSLGLELAATGGYLLVAWAGVRLSWPLAGIWASELGYWLLLAGLSWYYLRGSRWQNLVEQ